VSHDAFIRRHISSDGKALVTGCATIPAGLVIPGSVTTLDMYGATVPDGLVIPDSVTTLNMDRATIPAGLVIPDSVTKLDMYGATIPAGLVIPDSVTKLDMRYATIPAGLVIPDSVTKLDMRYATILGAPLYTCPRGYKLYALPRSNGDAVFWAGCKVFMSRAAAVAHWGGPEYPDRARGDAFVAAVEAYEARIGGAL
jgi:hypothetical protein